MEINIENLKTSIRDTIKHDFVENNNFNLKDDLNNAQIYIIINKTNGKMYIGQATCYVGKNNNSWCSIGRWKSHLREAIKNTDDHCVLLNNAIRKYGEHNFEIITLFKGNINEINEKEEYYIKILKSLTPNGYNLKTGGDKGKDSDETKQKKKEAHTGMEHSEKTKDKIRNSHIGKKMSDESKKKMSLARKGIPNPEAIEIMANINRGSKRIFTDEHKRKISESCKGRVAWNKGMPRSEETKQKLREIHKGRVMSEESKKKMSESHKKRYNSLKNNLNNLNEDIS